jgi:Apoptosis antagonizing transcription factor
MQRLVTGANRMPTRGVINAFCNKSGKIDAGLKNSKREMKGYIKDLTRIQKDLFTLSETTVKVKSFPEEDQTNESTTDSLFRIVDHNFSQVLPFVEETIDRWNSRT